MSQITGTGKFNDNSVVIDLLNSFHQCKRNEIFKKDLVRQRSPHPESVTAITCEYKNFKNCSEVW